ncbi:MAG: hypothetical protein Q9222_000803 [Ikaeria aurantiellina]
MVQGDTASPQVTWLFPESGPVQSYSQNDILNASWITSLNMMPSLISLCQETKSTGKSNISYSFVHATGSKLVPLDLWTGNHYPYICKLDFIDGVSDQPLNQPSNSFMIAAADTASSPSKIWSQDNVSQEVQAMSATNSTSATPSSTATNASAVNGSASAGSTDSPVKSTHGSGLSTGGIVGSVIAAVIGGALLSWLGAFCWARRRRDKQVSIESSQGQEFVPSTTADPIREDWVGIQEKDAAFLIAEVDNTGLTELSTGKREEHTVYS